MNYLDLVMFIARVMSTEGGKHAIEFTQDNAKRYPNLFYFRNEVRKLFSEEISAEGFAQNTSGAELLTEAFFFNQTKSVVTLEESRNQHFEYNLEADVSLTLTITSLRTTPEDDLVHALGRTNGIYLMSATGGLASASSGGFSVRYLQRALTELGGQFFEMSEEELAVAAREAARHMQNRRREVKILDDDDPASVMCVSDGYEGLKDAMLQRMPQRGDHDFAFLNRYKLREMEGLVASLDKLLSTELRSGLVLTQTLSICRRS